MNLIERIKNVIKPKIVAVRKEAPAMSQRMNVMNLPEPPAPKTKDYIEAMKGWVYIAVKAIAQEVAKIDLVLYRKRGGKVEVVDTHEMIDLLHTINPFTTMNDFIEATQSYLELCGESFWWKYKVGSRTKQIWMLRPDYVGILPPKSNKEYIGGYSYKVAGMEKATTYKIDEIIHFKYFDPTNPYRGMGALQAAVYAYDTDLFASKWNRNFFFNNAMPTTLLTTEQNMKKKDIDRIREEWKNKFGGVNKAHKMAILTGGLKVDDVLKQSIKDMDFLNLRKFSRDEIFTIFQVPKSIVTITEDVNLANSETGRMVWLDNVIKPKMTKFVSFLNEFFCPEWGEEYYFGFKDPSPTSVRNNLLLVEKGAQILTINERRELIEYEPIPDGDVIFTPFSMGSDNSENNDNEDKKDDKKSYIKIQGNKFKKRVNENIVIHKTTLSDKIRNRIMDEIKDNGVRDSLKEMLFLTINKGKKVSVKKKEENKTVEYQYISKEVREGFWKSMVARSENQEVTFAKKIRKYWDGQEKRVIGKLENGKSFKKGVDSYLYDVDDENKIFIKIINGLIQRIIAEAGTEALKLLGLSQSFDFKEEVLEEIEKFELKLAESINLTTREALKGALNEGITNSEGIADLTKRIQGVYSQADKARATMIARTETIRSNNYGNVEGYKQSGVVDSKEWMAALDERTCEFCLAMEEEYKQVGLENNFLNQGDILIGQDGGQMSVEYSNLGAPPLHPQCRCTVLLVVTVLGKEMINEKKKISKLKDRQIAIKQNIDEVKKEILTEKEKAKLEVEEYKLKKIDEANKKADEIVKVKESEAIAKKSKIIKQAKAIRKEARKNIYE